MSSAIELPGSKKPRTETLNLVPSQFTERHQAEDVPAVWGRRRINWRAVIATAWPFLAILAWIVMGALWTLLPWGVQAVCIVATPVMAIAAVWPMWRRGPR